MLEYHDEDWSQTIDYEHIPFRCRKCHEHGHLFRECPLNMPTKEGNPEASKDKDDFIQPAGKRRQGGRKPTAQVSKDPSTSNKFSILQNHTEDTINQENPIEPTPGIAPQSTSPGPGQPNQGQGPDLGH